MRSRRATFLFTAAVALGAVMATGCRVNQDNLAAADKLAPGTVANVAQVRRDVSYGTLASQKLDVYLPRAAAVGTIIYFHAGGWMAGDRTGTDEFLMAQINRGWALVSVEYRLAPAARAPEILADVDRSIRYVKQNAVALGLKIKPLVAAGASAGGHLALMAGVAPAVSVDPTLPAALKTQSPSVDAVVSLAGPSDLSTLWQGVWIAPSATEAFLGCAQTPTPITPGTPRCTKATVDRYSPIFWVRQADTAGKALPPVYLGYGTQDQLVNPATQAEPIYSIWTGNGRDLRTWYDLTPNAGHNVDFELNRSAFDIWMDKVRTGSW